MAVRKTAASDFSGGQAAKLAATDFTERQWAKLKGLVLESAAEARSQWACQKVGAVAGFVDVSSVSGYLVGLKADGTIWTAPEPASGDAATVGATSWTRLGAVADPALRILTTMPIRNETGEGFIPALLLNGQGSDDAHAVYVSGTPQLKTWTDRYPAGTHEAGMPRAGAACMWGDFLVLGDIEWLKDVGSGFTAANAARYPHGLWFAQPTSVEEWDTIDVQWMGVKGGPEGTRIVDLLPLDTGLLVLTTAGTFMLRGTSIDHEYEEVRVGLDATERGAQWGHVGAGAWVDAGGQVWHSNGNEFVRLDEPLGLPRSSGGEVAALGEFLVMSRLGRMFAFRAFTEDGAWTELVGPSAPTRLYATGDRLYLLDGDGQLWRFDRGLDAERGQLHGVNVDVEVATRTLETGDGHDVTYWHRVGARLSSSGSGRLQEVSIHPGPALDDSRVPMTRTMNRKVGPRDEVVLPAHGPSREVSVELKLAGDVSVEQVSAWHIEGRSYR